MLAASTALTDSLKKGDAVATKPRVYAEWNHNRYSAISTVDNFGYPESDNGYDLETFPISSITEPLRPTAGIAFAKTGEAVASSGYSSVPALKRFYTTDPSSKYKYWTSPTPSPATVGTIANCKPYVLYAAPVWTNKIYICVENSWGIPSDFIVEITTDGTTWTTVATNPSISASGVIELYLQSNNTWLSSPYYGNAMQVRGVRMTVTVMNRVNSYLNLIEMGLRLHNELTDYLIDYSVTNELSDPDFVTPMGIISANTGDVTLSNFDGRFNNDNPASLYYGLIDANVKFTIDLGIDTTAQGGSGFEYTRQATMFAESWNNGSESVSVSLKDASKFLQEINPLSMLMQNVGIGKAIWRILDSIGFNYYAYSQAADTAETIIPFFWTNPEKTVWEIIQEICKTTQSGAYFDQNGILQIKTREAAFDKTQANAWTFDYAQNGTKQPDIVELEATTTYEANKVTINYKPTMLAEDDQHRPISEIVWQPDGDLVLRSSALVKDMAVDSLSLNIDPKDASYWPYEGMVNIRGEIMKYVGKQYRYINLAGAWAYAKVTSNDVKYNIDNNLTKPGEQYRSVFTGAFYVTERGVGETSAQVQDSTIAGWVNHAYYGKGDVAMRLWNGGLKHIPQDGILRLQTNKTFTGNHWYAASRLASNYNSANYYFGARMRFPSYGAGANRCAGLFFSSSGNLRTMYVVDIMTTAAVAPYRSYRNEVTVIRRNGDGTNTYLGKGATVAISDNQWFDVDVQCDGAVFSVAINGQVVLNTTDPRADLPDTSVQGLMARGFTTVDFEYYYFASYTGGIFETGLDNSTYMDLRRGGYYSSQFYKDYTYYNSTRSIPVSRKVNKIVKMNSAQKYFDEFGMQVHEIRDFDVKFEKPVLYSSLYLSNQDQTVIPSYTGTAFGAKFTVANAARTNAVLNGDDTTLGTDNVVTQKAMITARTIQQQDVKAYDIKNDAAIRARGEIALTIDSDWIQSEGAAKALGDWIVNNWSDPSDVVEMETFANPLIQVGDVVAVNYAPRNMLAATHRYFVVSVKQSWDSGPATNLTLRRANI